MLIFYYVKWGWQIKANTSSHSPGGVYYYFGNFLEDIDWKQTTQVLKYSVVRPLANTWGSVPLEELCLSPINKEVADTHTFTAQSL